jgi:predicted alpha-1,2-mannosidase
MSRILSLLICLLQTISIFSQQNLLPYVNPLIGTQRMGHTYPGATVPFGMVQLSPDTDTISYEKEGRYNGEVYAYCAGYQYDDPTIVGFSHTHFSGTGHSDLGDFLVMPSVGSLQLNTGLADHPEGGYRSKFTHLTEVAEPAYYKVMLDVDGAYCGLDRNIHHVDTFTNYTTFSLWDTYRALHPLFNIIQPKRNADMIKSMLAHYDQSVHPMLPVWSHHANENWCMIGYHAVSVIADAAVKGNTGFDLDHALEACVNTASYEPYDGIRYYKELGYVPENKNTSSVSKTLEYAYDDWAISQMARHLENDPVQARFAQRAENFRNVFDPGTGFMRPKLADGSWKSPFDPLNTHGQGFIEGNAWNYSLYVPHRIPEMISLMGGKEKFSEKLDSLFSMHLPDENFKNTEDITRDGIVGCYVHGNEPGHHIPYLYNWTGEPWRTQETCRKIMDEMYGDTPDGLCGNDDCGQMSAWYIFSALGFYPVCPGSNWYAIGSPLVKSAVITLENGNKVAITVKNQSEENIYIKDIIINGKRYSGNYFEHKLLFNDIDTDIVIVMGPRPDKSWGRILPDGK